MNKLNITLTVIGGILTIFLGYLTLKDRYEKKVDFSGKWNFEFETQESTKKSFVGKTSVYTMYLSHVNGKIEGEGEKWKYDGEEIPHSSRIPLKIQGKYENDTIKFSFKHFGAVRHTYGNVTAFFKNGKFEGKFNADAATSKGEVVGIQEKD